MFAVMFAVKGNREYAISNETEKKAYIAQGFDIVDANGKLLAAGAGKKVSYEDYETLLAENETLLAEVEKLTKKK